MAAPCRPLPPVSGRCWSDVVRWLTGPPLSSTWPQRRSPPLSSLHSSARRHAPDRCPPLSCPRRPPIGARPHARPAPRGTPAVGHPPLLSPRCAPFKRAPPPSPAGFFSRAPVTLPLRPRRQRPSPLSFALVAVPLPLPLRPPTTAGATLHLNVVVLSRPLRPVVVPPPRCIPAGPALPDTSPS
jgi:hypothetical protein